MNVLFIAHVSVVRLQIYNNPPPKSPPPKSPPTIGSPPKMSPKPPKPPPAFGPPKIPPINGNPPRPLSKISSTRGPTRGPTRDPTIGIPLKKLSKPGTGTSTGGLATQGGGAYWAGFIPIWPEGVAHWAGLIPILPEGAARII